MWFEAGSGIAKRCHSISILLAGEEPLFEVLDGESQASFQGDARLPLQPLFRARNIRSPPLRVSLHAIFSLARQTSFVTSKLINRFRQFKNAGLNRVADIHRQMDIRENQPVEAFDKVIDIAEATGLSASSVDGQRLASQSLAYEIRHHAPIIQAHTWSIGIKDTDDMRIEVMIAMVSHDHRFSKAFGLVVHGAGTDWINIAHIFLALWVLQRIAVDLRGGGQQESGLMCQGDAKRIVGAKRTHFERLNRELRIAIR